MLVVEDDVFNRRLYARVLQTAGFTVDSAGNGLDALRILRASPYDIIVCDVMMPGMDGFELLRTMRAEPALSSVPVMLLTALAEDAHRTRAYELGADVYLTKPIQFDKLVQEVEAAIERVSTSREAGSAPSLAGRLDCIGPAVILTLLGSMAKSGVVRFQRAAAEGVVKLRDGVPVAADVHGGLQGVSAAALILSWTSGEFRFTEERVTEQDTIHMSVNDLLIGAVKRR